MTPTPQNALSLADLEAYDHAAASVSAKGERRFLCPLCGHDKPRDAAHRSLCANLKNGAWRCWRCQEAGKLTDFWEERPVQSGRARARADYERTFALAPEIVTSTTTPTPSLVEDVSPQASPQPSPERWRGLWREALPLTGTPGGRYLKSRSIPLLVATRSGACYCPQWHHAPAVLFPLSDRGGTGNHPVAVQGRHLAGSGKFTEGHKKHGVFRAPAFVEGQLWQPFDKRLTAVIITEGPCDALSFAVCGFPALALVGTSGPEWLPQACAFRRVMLATDADEAGDRAADTLWPMLASLAAEPARLSPAEAHAGAKDWNEALQMMGREALADYLSSRVL